MEYKKERTQFSSDYKERINKAEEYLDESKKHAGDTVNEAKYAMSSLCESMHAGEMLVFEHAKAKIESIQAQGF